MTEEEKDVSKEITKIRAKVSATEKRIKAEIDKLWKLNDDIDSLLKKAIKLGDKAEDAVDGLERIREFLK